MAKKGSFWAISTRKRFAEQPNGHIPKTVGILRYLRIWGKHDPIESGLSDAKNVGYVGVAEKKKQNLGPKMQFFCRQSNFCNVIQMFCYHHDAIPIRQRARQAGTYQKTEGIQSYLRTWGRNDPIESGLLKAKKVGFVCVA